MKSTLQAALFSVLLCTSARGQEQAQISIDNRHLEIADVVVCDTQEEVERYIAAFNGDQSAAVRAVNRAERDPRACGIASAAFLRGPRVASTSHGYVAFEIVRILVLGVEGPDGLSPVTPAPYFTVFGVTEYPI